jgi:hypothetical protein
MASFSFTPLADTAVGVATLATPMINNNTTTTMPALEPIVSLQQRSMKAPAREEPKDEKEREKEKNVARSIARPSLPSTHSAVSSSSSLVGPDGLPRAPGNTDFLRTYLRGQISMLNTAEGWLARWPMLTTSQASVESFCHMLMTFFDDAERARKVFAEDEEVERFRALFDGDLRAALTTHRLAITNEDAARKLAGDVQRETKALLDSIYVWNSATNKISLGEPPRFNRQEAMERLAVQSQKQLGVMIRWYDAVEALDMIEHTDTGTLHERIAAALAGARKMLLTAVQPDFRSLLFPGEGAV